MYELDCAYIQSTGRVYRDQQVFIIGYLAGNDDLLLVTAGQSSGRSLCAAPRTDIEFLDQIQRMLLDGLPVQNAMFRIRCFLKMLQDQVILIGEFQNQSVLLAVSRDTGCLLYTSPSPRDS